MAFEIGERTGIERYRMRSVAGGYLGDKVFSFGRVINGSKHHFSRIEWGDGAVTVASMKEGSGPDADHYFLLKGPTT